jgi:hypothetical protein
MEEDKMMRMSSETVVDDAIALRKKLMRLTDEMRETMESLMATYNAMTPVQHSAFLKRIKEGEKDGS